MMTTADMAFREDPEFRKISERFKNDPAAFRRRLARAWFKLATATWGQSHAISDPKCRRGPDLAGPDSAADYAAIDQSDIADLKRRILDSGLSVPSLVKTAWASASTYRGSDHRGGANGGTHPPRSAAQLGGQRARGTGASAQGI